LNFESLNLSEQFNSAVIRSRELSSRPSNEDLLQLYALYKQATEGDVTGDRPGGFDFKAIAKYDAWVEVKGKSKEAAMQEYIGVVERLAVGG
jgi:diazepam-binding inhibitor (GABA receptor modulator, acyl-CoA-binding protein)